jgi:ribosomal protein S18 acetylase RimI-like enzyme
MVGVQVELGDASRVAELRPLWLALHRHHRVVASYGPLVEDEELSWELRRHRYLEALAAGDGTLVIASARGNVVGYAFVLLHPGADDTFEHAGDGYAELFTLCVAEHMRGHGIGGLLCDTVEAHLAERGVSDLEVAVMAGNGAAARFYHRRGYAPAEELLRRRITVR